MKSCVSLCFGIKLNRSQFLDLCDDSDDDYDSLAAVYNLDSHYNSSPI